MAGNERLIRIFEHALQQEFTGRTFFKSSLQRMGWGSAVTAFQRLIQEEEKHIEMIEKILFDLKKGSPVALPTRKGPEEEPVNYFEERAKKEFFARCLPLVKLTQISGKNLQPNNCLKSSGCLLSFLWS